MALFEVNPSGHWSTHFPSYNEYLDIHVIQFVARIFAVEINKWNK